MEAAPSLPRRREHPLRRAARRAALEKADAMRAAPRRSSRSAQDKPPASKTAKLQRASTGSDSAGGGVSRKGSLAPAPATRAAVSNAAIATTLWVQCDACSTWRALPEGTAAEALPERWECQQHPLPLRCAVTVVQTAAVFALPRDVLVAIFSRLSPRARINVRKGGGGLREKEVESLWRVTR